jgi:hypothetical protein
VAAGRFTARGSGTQLWSIGRARGFVPARSASRGEDARDKTHWLGD